MLAVQGNSSGDINSSPVTSVAKCVCQTCKNDYEKNRRIEQSHRNSAWTRKWWSMQYFLQLIHVFFKHTYIHNLKLFHKQSLVDFSQPWQSQFGMSSTPDAWPGWRLRPPSSTSSPYPQPAGAAPLQQPYQGLSPWASLGGSVTEPAPSLPPDASREQR